VPKPVHILSRGNCEGHQCFLKWAFPGKRQVSFFVIKAEETIIVPQNQIAFGAERGRTPERVDDAGRRRQSLRHASARL
jgi:hypothetical protein